MRILELNSWDDFKSQIGEYTSQDVSERERFVFRGQSDSDWNLLTTLDRATQFQSSSERRGGFSRLMQQFRRESSGVLQNTDSPLTDTEWELLARHHRLPTLLLDWTQSPFIAAFFAFESAEEVQSSRVAVWALNRNVFRVRDIPSIDVIDDYNEIRCNPRAIEQRAVFLRINDIDRSTEEYLDDGLVKYEIPASEYRQALVELDEMAINARTLFRDLDGAARTASWRLFG